MVNIHDGLTKQQADIYSLVLSAVGIEHQTLQVRQGWQIQVPEHMAAQAVATIAAYVSENSATDNAPAEPAWPVTRTFAGLLMALALVGVHLVVVTSDKPKALRHLFAASADKILNGDLYRITTALLLHADGLHLIGNVVGMAIFATAVCSTAGFGAGGLMILASGMLGNLANALLYKSGHHSIGASTAVFGAIGIAAAHQLITKWQQTGQRFKAWVPFGGGLALLGLLGSSPNTDLMAHFFGFILGFLIGIFFTVTRNGPPGKRAQYAGLLLTVTLILISFTIPY